MKIIILVFFLIAGCTYDQTKKKNINSNIKFSEDLSLEEFKNKLKEYSTNNPFPNIDN